MIRSFVHKGLRIYLVTGTTAKLPKAEHQDRIKQILSLLDAATVPRHMGLPGLCFHPWHQGSGIWSVKVSGNWRVLFRFANGDAFDVEIRGHD